jgi:hypothetical protein
MHAYVVLRDPEGRDHELVPGDLVGRVWSAALQLDDGRVSEAHAMVSLREGELQLVALRGALAFEGTPANQVALRPGARVQLARDVFLEVVEVNLPAEVMGVEGAELPRQVLPGVCSVLVDPPATGQPRGAPRIARGWRDEAALRIWTTGDRWMARAQGEARPLLTGDEVEVEGHKLRFVAIPVRDAGPRTTRRQGDLDGPLRVVAQYDTVHVHRPGAPPLALCGLQARLVSELVAVGGPIAWTALADELWPDESELSVRRVRLDTLLSRVRRRLRAAGIRADLVRTDGAGQVELLRYPHDRVEDRT